MFTPARIICVVLFALSLTTRIASAESLALEGIVTGSDGSPVNGAQITVAGKEDGGGARIVNTNAKGHYLAGGLGEGTFNVTLSINGAVKASIANVRVWPGIPKQQLNFALKSGKIMPQARGKHFVWVPSSTGSNLAGGWVEADDERPVANAKAARDRIDNAGGRMIQRIQDNVTGVTHTH
jgi:Carboxypeptidase regulatory-like domain